VSGPTEQISRLVVAKGLAVAMRPVTRERPDSLVNREMGVVEVVVPPRSPFVGEVVFPGMLRRGDVLILAIKRVGKDKLETEVEAGDAMLLYGPWPAVESLVDDRDVLVVDSPDLHRRQAVALGPKALRAGVILVGMVVLLAFDLVPPAIGALIAAGAMVLAKVVSSPQAYRAVSWETVVLVGGLIPLSTAVQSSGAADDIATQVTRLVGDGHPLVLMVVLFALIAVLGLVISNTATVLLSLPIAAAAAAETGVSPQPLLMLTAVAASAALLTPVQTPANLMIMAPGGYRFGDYWRLGLPIMLFWLTVCLVVIPLAWPFSG
jgi:di/tricarboxylate transporter